MATWPPLMVTKRLVIKLIGSHAIDLISIGSHAIYLISIGSHAIYLISIVLIN